jgi:hypothetical protein
MAKHFRRQHSDEIAKPTGYRPIVNAASNPPISTPPASAKPGTAERRLLIR